MKYSKSKFTILVYLLSFIFVLGFVSLGLTSFSAQASVESGYEHLSEGLSRLYNLFGDYQEGDKIVVSKDDIEVIDGEEYINNSVLPTNNKVKPLSLEELDDTEDLISLNSLSECGYEVTETEDEITLSSASYTNRIIVYYEGDLASYNTSYYAEGLGWHIYQYNTPQQASDAYYYYSSMLGQGNVSYDDIVTIQATETEQISAQSSYLSWGANVIGAVDYNVYLNALYSSEQMNDVYVAVLDSGANTKHQLLSDRLALEYSKDFTGIVRNVTYEIEDDNGHGSHVSGIIANLTNSNVKIIPLKILDSVGKGTISMILEAIEYVLNLNQNYDLNIRLMNMSVGVESEDGSAVTNTSLNTAIKKAYSNNVFSIVAAGNGSQSTDNCTPANAPDAITISALNSDKTFASGYSNYGQHINFSAPGTSIYSAYIGGSNVYKYLSGTSMATPHATAVFALILSNPSYADLSCSDIKYLLETCAEDLGEEGWDKYYGFGCISLSNLGFETEGEIIFSETEQMRDSSFALALSYNNVAEDQTCKIYYTLNESTPSLSNGNLYSSTITISKTTKIIAVAYVYSSDVLIKMSNITSITYYFDNIDLESSFELDSNNYISKYKGELSILNVQQRINGSIVQGVADYAFYNSGVKEVVLPTSVYSSTIYFKISDYAFYSCKTLTKITGTDVATIGKYSFAGCSNLSEVALDNVVEIGYGAFKDCLSIDKLQLFNIKSIAENVFENAKIGEVWLGYNLSTLNSSNNALIDKLYVYDNEDFEEIYLNWSDDITYLDMSITVEGRNRIVTKKSNAVEIDFVVYGNLISNKTYSIKNGQNQTVSSYISYQIEEIDNLTERVKFTFSGANVGTYKLYVQTEDVYGNYVTSDTVEIVLVANTAQEFSINLSDGEYDLYIDGEQVPDSFVLYEGVQYNAYVQAHEGYLLQGLTIDGQSSSYEFILSNLSSDVNINCQVQEIVQFELNFIFGEGVHVLKDGVEIHSIVAEKDETVEFSVFYDEGLEGESVIVNGISYEIQNAYTFTDIKNDYQIEITSRKRQFTITLEIGLGGISQLNKYDVVDYGTSKTWTFEPDNGYRLAHVYVDGQESNVQENNTLVLENITSNKTIYVTFEKIANGVFDENERAILIYFCIFAGIFVVVIIVRICMHIHHKKKYKLFKM